MSGRRPSRLAWVTGGALAVLIVVLILLPKPEAAGSSLSRAASGWWAARAYLEARGVEVTLRDVPFDHVPQSSGTRSGTMSGDGPRGTLDAEPIDADVVVVVFPLQVPFGVDELDRLAEHLRDGGVLVVGYSGESRSGSEARLLELIGFGATTTLRPPPPLAPAAWWRHQEARFTLVPGSGYGGRELGVPAFDVAPVPTVAAPAGERVLYQLERRADGSAREPLPLVRDLPHLGGRVVLLPASLFANTEVADSLDLLESLASLGARWSFAEHVHGLLRPSLDEANATTAAWDLFLAHLALAYLALVAMIALRFGPPWRESTRAHGSTADFLRSVGTLHHRLHHHRDAARRLVERVARLDPRASLPDQPLPAAGDGDALVRFARTVAHARRRTTASRSLHD